MELAEIIAEVLGQHSGYSLSRPRCMCGVKLAETGLVSDAWRAHQAEQIVERLAGLACCASSRG